MLGSLRVFFFKKICIYFVGDFSSDRWPRQIAESSKSTGKPTTRIEMSTIPLSPAARTPSKNVERLLSLQKSAKHLTGADILSFAAEASAMKRMAMAPSDVSLRSSQPVPTLHYLTDSISSLFCVQENREPNSHQVPKRLFDISKAPCWCTAFRVHH
jgi:hypothetical protein